jgi:hypothetical protein
MDNCWVCILLEIVKEISRDVGWGTKFVETPKCPRQSWCVLPNWWVVWPNYFFQQRYDCRTSNQSKSVFIMTDVLILNWCFPAMLFVYYNSECIINTQHCCRCERAAMWHCVSCDSQYDYDVKGKQPTSFSYPIALVTQQWQMVSL